MTDRDPEDRIFGAWELEHVLDPPDYAQDPDRYDPQPGDPDYDDGLLRQIVDVDLPPFPA